MACAQAADELIPVKPKARHRIPWETEEVIEKRTELKKAAQNKNTNPTRANRYHHRITQAVLKQTYDMEQSAYIQAKINIIANSSVNKQAATAWKTDNEISGRISCNKARTNWQQLKNK